jgi:hypothetical protein
MHERRLSYWIVLLAGRRARSGGRAGRSARGLEEGSVERPEQRDGTPDDVILAGDLEAAGLVGGERVVSGRGVGGEGAVLGVGAAAAGRVDVDRIGGRMDPGVVEEAVQRGQTNPASGEQPEEEDRV